MSKRHLRNDRVNDDQDRRSPSVRSLESEEGMSRVSREPEIVMLSPSPGPKAVAEPAVGPKGSSSTKDREAPSRSPKSPHHLPLRFRSSPLALRPLVTDTTVPQHHRRKSSSSHDQVRGGAGSPRYTSSPRSPLAPGHPTRPSYHHIAPFYSSPHAREYDHRPPLYPHPPHHAPHAYGPYSPAPPGYPHRHHSSLPPIHTQQAEYYPTPISTDRFYPPIPPPGHPHPRTYPHAYEAYYLPYPPHSYVYPPRREPGYRVPSSARRSRLHGHPYAPPPGRGYAKDGMRYHSAGPVPSEGHRNLAAGPSAGVRERRSPASAIVPRGAGGANFKSLRKRADDVQLSILSDVFQRTAYPTTEERDKLARQLGMTSRSVQIWFQNRRRAVKVDQQSAAQRAEAEYRELAVNSRTHGMLPGAMYAERRPMSGELRTPDDVVEEREGVVREDAGVKRERVSP
ncbi:hypothetical protein I350_07715 [Cryptococcus amylolentus CBS 6273]|uniref:Homeobox domain-containing protein n=1 Tax=Cryptococcus amylolentus CBS 6273 TaxID=1296118 RepID=A0A1E3JB26_9TREE|nr:hypothetical protein I350_07715 [Cryptococcus amylolentus CBS 6273]